jgi:TetR/AcrR family transcriptional regulator
MKRAEGQSRARILDAARQAFAESGFAGAGVDRIARQARVNKALIYYYFTDKQTLYTTVLEEMFTAFGDRLRPVLEETSAPADKLDRFIAVIVDFIEERPYMPRIMMRELAEGGRHLDAGTLARMGTLANIVSRLIEEGTAARAFRPVDPVLTYFTVMGPVVMFLGGAPIREALTRRHLLPAGLDNRTFTRHLQAFVRGGLATTGPAAARRRSRPAAGGSTHEKKTV